MRILAVTNMYPTPRTPGLGTFVEQQINGLRHIGLNVDVVFVDRVQRGTGVYADLGRLVLRKINRFEPDVVHAMYGGVMASQVTRIVHDRPTVVTFHGSDLFGEHLSGFVRKLIAGYGVWASRRAARRATAVVVVWKGLQKALPKYVDRSKVTVIPCGIDLNQFKPLDRVACRSRLGWDPNRFHILFPANAGDPVKRPNLARAAIETMNSGFLAEMHPLRGIPNSEVPIWINASDVLLLTSFRESSPTVVKEALACNVPVVSVDVGDVRERIQGIEGCYLAMADPEDLASKLALVYSGTRRVAGRLRMQDLTLERIALHIKSLYENVVQSWG